MQHVANTRNAQSIRQSGFSTDTPAWDRSFGDGVYFSYSGDEKSRRFYSRQGGRGKLEGAETVKARVALDNPAEFNVKSHNDFRIQAAERLGGPAAVRERAQRDYDAKQKSVRKILKEELGSDFDKVDGKDGPAEDMFFWNVDPGKANMAFDRISKEIGGPPESLRTTKRLAQDPEVFTKVKQGHADQYEDLSRHVANMLKDDGHDGLIINTNRWGGVGGQQIVVFDVGKIKIS